MSALREPSIVIDPVIEELDNETETDSRKKHPKIKPPKHFIGDRTDLCRFLAQIAMYFAFTEH